jgi:branched-chain amino acid transport system substrate-binding protein
MPDVSQYMMDVNHWFNPKSEKAQTLKKRVEAGGALFTFEVYLGYSAAMLLADSLERAGSTDKAKLTDALASSTFKAELMPYGPTKFVNGQNQGARPAVMQSLKGDIEVIAPEAFASAKAVFPKPKL